MDKMLCLIDAVETYNALKKCLPPSLILSFLVDLSHIDVLDHQTSFTIR